MENHETDVSYDLGAPSSMAADSTWSKDLLSISKEDPKGFSQTREQTRRATTFLPTREMDLDVMFEIAAMLMYAVTRMATAGTDKQNNIFDHDNTTLVSLSLE